MHEEALKKKQKNKIKTLEIDQLQVGTLYKNLELNAVVHYSNSVRQLKIKASVFFCIFYF